MSTTQDVLYHMGGVPVHGEFTTGNVFFVDSNRENKKSNNGKKPSTAFATLDEATNACTANNHDIVYIMPNHAETLSAATTWVPDVAGVSYIGVGMGADAPELTFTATDSIITISGGNNLFQNLRFIAGVSLIVTGLDVDADHVTIDGCTWDFTTTDFDFISMIDIDSFDYCTIQNCRFIAENATAGSEQAIWLDAADHIIIKDNLFSGDFSISCIANPSTDAAGLGLFILNNVTYNDDTAATTGSCILLENAYTGVIANNTLTALTTGGGDLTIDPGSCMLSQNYVSTLIDKFAAATLVGTAST